MFTIAFLVGLLMPPAQYDHEPIRPYQVHFASPQVIERECNGLELQVARLANPRARALGCTQLKSMDVWIDYSLSYDDQLQVLQHERGHVNGWRH